MPPIPWEEQARFTAELKQKPKKESTEGRPKIRFNTMTYEDTASALHALNGVTKLGVSCYGSCSALPPSTCGF
jgi:hypothetical protein